MDLGHSGPWEQWTWGTVDLGNSGPGVQWTLGTVDLGDKDLGDSDLEEKDLLCNGTDGQRTKQLRDNGAGDNRPGRL